MGLCQSSHRDNYYSEPYRPALRPPHRARAPRVYSANYDGGPPCPYPPCRGLGRCGHGIQRPYVQGEAYYVEEIRSRRRRRKSVSFNPRVAMRRY
jgi:hypothetical protein